MTLPRPGPFCQFGRVLDSTFHSPLSVRIVRYNKRFIFPIESKSADEFYHSDTKFEMHYTSHARSSTAYLHIRDKSHDTRLINNRIWIQCWQASVITAMVMSAYWRVINYLSSQTYVFVPKHQYSSARRIREQIASILVSYRQNTPWMREIIATKAAENSLMAPESIYARNSRRCPFHSVVKLTRPPPGWPIWQLPVNKREQNMML